MPMKATPLATVIAEVSPNGADLAGQGVGRGPELRLVSR